MELVAEYCAVRLGPALRRRAVLSSIGAVFVLMAVPPFGSVAVSVQVGFEAGPFFRRVVPAMHAVGDGRIVVLEIFIGEESGKGSVDGPPVRRQKAGDTPGPTSVFGKAVIGNLKVPGTTK